MRILFLSHYFPPEVNAPASRTYEHCKEWVQAGHQVTVVTCAPNHPRGVVYPGFRNRLWQRETRDGIDVIRLWTYVTANEGFLKRTLGYLSFLWSCVLAMPFLPTADVVITTSPQFFNGLAGYPFKLLRRIPWVLEIRDLWPESIVTVGALKNKWVIRLLEALELFAYRNCDQIVPVTDSFRRYMLAKGISRNKISVIKNGVDLSFYRSSADPAALKARLQLEGKFVAAYFGTHGMAHHLETIFDAAEILQHEPRIVFLMVGDGGTRKQLVETLQARGLKNVVMLDQQPKELMPQLWALADASLVLLKKSPLFETVIPSKIFESMAMGKPVILGVAGEARDIVESGQAGIAVEPEAASALAAAVLRLFHNPAERDQLGANGRNFVAANFERRVLARRYEHLLTSLQAEEAKKAVLGTDP